MTKTLNGIVKRAGLLLTVHFARGIFILQKALSNPRPARTPRFLQATVSEKNNTLAALQSRSFVGVFFCSALIAGSWPAISALPCAEE